eukprot:5854677-Pyramimonas_sp.AAC.1
MGEITGQDAVVEVYEAKVGETMRVLARCVGHGGTIRALDWSTCGAILRSDSATKEILYFDAATGNKVYNCFTLRCTTFGHNHRVTLLARPEFHRCAPIIF